MSLINKFTIGFYKEKSKKKDSNDHSSLQVNSNKQHQNKQVLSQELFEILITFGFEIRQIITAFKEYKFMNIDEACYFLMRDNETGKYNHKFHRDVNEENLDYSNIKKNVCFICGNDPSEHYDFDMKSKRFSVNNKEINNNQINHNDLKSNNHADIKNIYNRDDILYNNVNEGNSNIINNDRSIDKFTSLNNSVNLGKIISSGFNNKNSISGFKNNENVNKNKFNGILDKIENNNNNKNKIIKKKIDIPSETLCLFEDPDICKICCTVKVVQSNKAEFACGHKFCRKCVTNYLTNSINNGKVYN